MKDPDKEQTKAIIGLIVSNVLIRTAWLAAMVYCLHTDHWKFAIACVVGAMLAGDEIRLRNSSTDDEE